MESGISVSVDDIFSSKETIHATAVFLGERIDAKALDHEGALARSPLVQRVGSRGCAVILRYGAIVFFHTTSEERERFVESIAEKVTAPFIRPEVEEVEIVLGATEQESVDLDGKLRLRRLDVGRIQVVAEILAKSTALSYYEQRVSEVFDHVEPLASALRRGSGGKTRTSVLLRQLGDAMLTQTWTVGRVEVTEKPEITWDRSELDRLYERLSVEYELRDRDLALTRKLDLISSTSSTLLDLVQTRRSLRVEWYIVLLILVEIVLIVYDIWVGG